MSIEGWKYYNHAAIPTTAPHEEPNLMPIESGLVWTNIEGGTPLLARWQSDWDCGYETQWWYCIKDTPYDIAALKSKRRYEINKGNKNFHVKKIALHDYENDLYQVTLAAYSSWPEKYRPHINEETFLKQVEEWDDADIFGGFEIETGRLAGYAMLRDLGSYVEFSVLRVMPETERMGINAAMVAGILEYYNNRFNGKFYINDGSRTIRHETAFQDYLEKYFDFRKAYCRLNIRYRKGFGILIKVLYPFRNIIKPDSRLGSKISGILKMEEICRSF